MPMVEAVIEIILNIEVEALTRIHIRVTVRVQLQLKNDRSRTVMLDLHNLLKFTSNFSKFLPNWFEVLWIIFVQSFKMIWRVNWQLTFLNHKNYWNIFKNESAIKSIKHRNIMKVKILVFPKKLTFKLLELKNTAVLNKYESPFTIATNSYLYHRGR